MIIPADREHRGSVSSADISRDGALVLTTGADGAGIVWTMAVLTRARLLSAGAGTPYTQ